MTKKGLNVGLILSTAFVLVVILGFWVWPVELLGVEDRPRKAADFGQLLSAAQSIFSGLALIGVIYTILQQQLDLREQREKADTSLELATAAALFAYYNEKIASLRRAINRDAPDDKKKNLMRVGNWEENAKELDAILQKHRELRARMETLNAKLAPPKSRPTDA